jgi:23S rRNA (adenine1618-N6)-methyltransferase
LSTSQPAPKQGLHPRSRHRERYDFDRLVASCPELVPYLARTPYGDTSVDFGDPAAVRVLNKALLAHFYGVVQWEIPADYLCPPIPGRADCLHHLADLLASCHGGVIPKGPEVRVLDIGTGASCIYPLLGHREYGWRFLASDIDAGALASAQRILAANDLEAAIELRRQGSPGSIFQGILQPGEVLDATLCNPPFHASLREAREGTDRKWRNLGREGGGRNFGGRGAELWCPGGEAAFLARMIQESAGIPHQCLWFTSLLAKSAHLPGVRAALKGAGVRELRILDMAQGQKKSRLVAWTFLDSEARARWSRVRWGRR